jgi:preprotein translocase subunit Sss1
MAEDQSNTDVLKSQADQMNLALESVISEDQARELINGRIQDAFLIKCKVDVENRSGAMLILVSSYKKKVLVMYSLFGNSPILRKIRTFEDYQQFSLDFIEVQNAGGLDAALSDMIGHSVYEALDGEAIEYFLPFWEKKDIATTNQALEKAIMKNSRVNRVKVISEVDQISSIKFRYKNPMQGVVNPVTPPQDTPEAPEEEEIDENELQPYQRLINNITSQYSKKILCETMLSPVNGVEFDDLVEGQEILFKIPYSSPQEKATAQALGCVDKVGSVMPLVGKFISIVNGDGEYYILAQGPSNTVIYSVEERPVRVATTIKKSNKPQNIDLTKQSSGNLGILVIGGIAFIILIIVMLLLL